MILIEAMSATAGSTLASPTKGSTISNFEINFLQNLKNVKSRKLRRFRRANSEAKLEFPDTILKQDYKTQIFQSLLKVSFEKIIEFLDKTPYMVEKFKVCGIFNIWVF